MDQKLNHQPRLTMRVAKGSLIFTMPDGSSATQIAYDRYVPKSGMSLPANLREAYKTEELLRPPYKKSTGARRQQCPAHSHRGIS